MGISRRQCGDRVSRALSRDGIDALVAFDQSVVSLNGLLRIFGFAKAGFYRAVNLMVGIRQIGSIAPSMRWESGN
jgi:hypothetical protein